MAARISSYSHRERTAPGRGPRKASSSDRAFFPTQKWYSENRVNGSSGRTDHERRRERGNRLLAKAREWTNGEVRMRTFLGCVLSLVGSVAFSAEPLRVGVVVFDGFLSSEVVAPMEVFAKATSEGTQPFEVVTIAASGKPVRSHDGLLIQPAATFADNRPLDVLVVPSTMDMDRVLADRALVAFIKGRGAQARYVASHC